MRKLRRTKRTSSENEGMDPLSFTIMGLLRSAIILWSPFILLSCQESQGPRSAPVERSAILGDQEKKGDKVKSPIDTNGNKINSRFPPPSGCERIELDSPSFAHFLRHSSLKPHGSPVKLHDGSLKGDQSVHAAVLDRPIGDRDLHQCADAVIRLRAEYLYQREAYERIVFHFTNGFAADYAKWRKGKRIRVEGNECEWVKDGRSDQGRESFEAYLRTVYTYAGSLSLSRELRAVPMDSMRIGDVLIEGGSPGHAVIVMDMAKDTVTGERSFLLAQSYMPAQEIHLLKNPNDDELSPWYSLKEIEEDLQTPEWTFDRSDLKRFSEL